MNGHSGTAEVQASALLRILRDEQRARCSELKHEAADRAATLVRRARRDARVHVSATVTQERRRFAATLQRAIGRIETERRKLRNRKYAALLRSAWPLLKAKLQDRWRDATDRRIWCDVLLEEGMNVFLQRTWTVDHPEGWAADEQERFSRKVAGRREIRVVFNPCRGLDAGLRLRTETGRLDGTVDGLLAYSADIEGLLLAEFEQARARMSSGDESRLVSGNE